MELRKPIFYINFSKYKTTNLSVIRFFFSAENFWYLLSFVVSECKTSRHFKTLRHLFITHKSCNFFCVDFMVVYCESFRFNRACRYERQLKYMCKRFFNNRRRYFILVFRNATNSIVIQFLASSSTSYFITHCTIMINCLIKFF